MSKYQATISVAPRFSFPLTVRKWKELEKRTNSLISNSHSTSNKVERLDLSYCKVLICCAEPIQSSTPVLFHECFTDYSSNLSSVGQILGIGQTYASWSFFRCGVCIIHVGNLHRCLY